MTRQLAIIVGAVALVVAFGASYAIGAATGGSDESAPGEAQAVPRSGGSPEVSKLNSGGALPALQGRPERPASAGGSGSPPETGPGSGSPSNPAPTPGPAPAPQPKPKPKGDDDGGKRIF